VNGNYPENEDVFAGDFSVSATRDPTFPQGVALRKGVLRQFSALGAQNFVPLEGRSVRPTRANLIRTANAQCFNANENKGLANRNAGFNCGICHKILDASHCALKSHYDQPPQKNTRCKGISGFKVRYDLQWGGGV